MRRTSTFLALALVGACADDGAPSFGDDPANPQLPPRGTSDIQAWLAGGDYLAWHCEPEPHASRPPSPHGRNRICSNDALSAAPAGGAFPVGAASVKEIYDGAAITFHAVVRKMTDGTGGSTWYWYEGNDDKVYANGEGDGTCTGCHAGAPRDFVFTVIR